MAKRGENIYKRKDGRYEGRYIKGRRLDGKPLFGYIYGRSYGEVKAALTIAKAHNKQPEQLCFVGDGSLAVFIHFWFDNINVHVKPSTYSRYRERACGHIIPTLGHIPVCQFTKEQAQEFVNDLSKKGLAPSTVASIAGLLRSIMRSARELRLTNTNPCEGLILPPIKAQERRALERGEQIKLERAAEQCGESVDLGVFLALYAGLRIGEICALRWRDIDLYSGTATVRATLQRVKLFGDNTAKTTLLEGPPKSGSSMRLIPLPPELTDRLRRYMSGVTAECYVLTGGTCPIEPRSLRAKFHKAAEKAGLSIPFHSLRHTYATRCIEHNFDVQALSELLGHSTATTTMKIYAHSVLEHKRQLTQRLHVLSDNYKPSREPSNIQHLY